MTDAASTSEWLVFVEHGDRWELVRVPMTRDEVLGPSVNYHEECARRVAERRGEGGKFIVTAIAFEIEAEQVPYFRITQRAA